MNEHEVADFAGVERQHWLSAKDTLTAEERAASPLASFDFIDLHAIGEILALRFRIRDTLDHEYVLPLDLAAWEGEPIGTATALFEYIRFRLVDDSSWRSTAVPVSGRVSIVRPEAPFV